MDIRKLMQTSPYVEVAIRQVYWRQPKLIERQNRKPAAKAELADDNTFAAVISALRDWGVDAGELLVVHSGYEGIKPAGASPQQVIDALLELVGPDGTLAMSTIPFFRKQPKGHAYMTADMDDVVFRFDPARTPCATGQVAYLFTGHPGVVRSQHPLNTMAAVGPHAAAMMAGNLDGDEPLACGPTSSWKYCVDHDATVVAIGIDLVHSLTMIHTAEDCAAHRWPQSGWYRKRRFSLVDGGQTREIVVRERKPRWSMHYAERTLHRDLIRDGLARHRVVNGVPISIVRARPLYNYLLARNERGYPYFLLPEALPAVGGLLRRI